MGERSHIIVQSHETSESTVIYGHWAGPRNVETVKVAEKAGARMVGCPAYLTASLFHFFSTHPNSGYDGVLSYGIWTQKDVGPETLDANWPPVYVNADTGEWRTEKPYTFPKS
jgi:hypothetical protein